MPLVRISVCDRMAAERRLKLPRAVYDAMREAISIPEGDLFVVLTTHADGELVFDSNFMTSGRSSDFALVHITLRRGRSTEMKQGLYRQITRLIQERAGISPEDVMVVLTENDLADWSFSRGEAQYVISPPAQSRGAES